MLTWPIATIDFEASGLGPQSSPIEVGIAVWPAFDITISVWSTLILPCADWQRHGEWNPRSEAIHKINQGALSSGMSTSACATEVVRLSRENGGLFADGGQHDAFWLSRLLVAGDTGSAIGLRSWQHLLRELPYEVVDSIQTRHEREAPPHRAGADASRLLFALASAYGADVQVKEIGIGDDRANPPSAVTTR